jgi:hypothetical protein
MKLNKIKREKLGKENEKDMEYQNEEVEGEDEEEEEDDEQDQNQEQTQEQETGQYNIEEEHYEREDNQRRKMIGDEEDYTHGRDNIKIYKKKYKKGKSKVIFMIFLAIFTFIVLILFLSSKKRRRKIKSIFSKTSSNSTDAYDDEDDDKIGEALKNIYNNIGEVNIMKFSEEQIGKKSYFIPDSTNFTHIHINLGFSENNINTVLKHLSSALYHSSKSTFLHIHMMDADTFHYSSMKKLKNMILKINNNTEIIVYNASQAISNFKIREDSIPKFLKDYAKLAAFKLIKNVQKIIFLDTENCMVQKDLTELYNLDLTDIYGRGVPEVPSLKNQVDWLDKYLFDKSHYMNGGVVLINLALCQEDGFYDKAIQLNNDDFYTKTEEPAQDILNVLMRKKIEFFHPKYNKINYYENPEDKSDETKWYSWVIETLKIGEKYNHFYTKEELIKADDDPVIIHYAWEKQLNKTVKKYEEDKNFYAKLLGIS